ncbi:family 20 glycosylhydrolase [Streptococcus sp. E17BB]|uniref:family 20 glycosylhydrolase n=1 Tax=Streptococcus sp. E17BB TaxID=3278714 RepID=UPI00359D14A8
MIQKKKLRKSKGKWIVVLYSALALGAAAGHETVLAEGPAPQPPASGETGGVTSSAGTSESPETVISTATAQPLATPNTNHLKAAEVTASDVETGTSFTAEKAVDGDEATRWATDRNPSQPSLTLTLTNDTHIERVEIDWDKRDNAGKNAPDPNVRRWRLSYATSDATNANPETREWLVAYERSSGTPAAEEVVNLAAPVVARYLKLDILESVPGTINWNNVGVREVRAFSNPSDSALPTRLEQIDALAFNDTKTQLVLPELTGVELIGSDKQGVIDLTGRVYQPLTNQTVKVMLKQTLGTAVATKEFEVAVTGRYADEGVGTKPAVVPVVQQWHGVEGTSTITADTVIVADDSNFGRAAELYREDLLSRGLTLSTGDSTAAQRIEFKKVSDKGYGQEGYGITINNGVITIEADHHTGAFYATRTLLQLGESNLQNGEIRDFPSFSHRGFLLDTGRKFVPFNTVVEMMKNMAYYKMNDLQLHLNDNYIFLKEHIKDKHLTSEQELDYVLNNASTGFRAEIDVVGENGVRLTSKDHYTKDELRALVRLAGDLGINLVPEIDTPGHALSFVKVRPDLMYKGASLHRGKHNVERVAMLDLGEKYDETLAFVKSVYQKLYFDEDAPLKDVTTVHIGTDEYYGEGDHYRRYLADMLQYVKEKGKTPRFWGSLSFMSGDQAIDGRGTELQVWNVGWHHPNLALSMGAKVINITDNPTYSVPSGSGSVGGYGDYAGYTTQYDRWTPNDFRTGGGPAYPASHPQIIGGGHAVWNDNIDLHETGITSYDVFKRFFVTMGVTAEKTWGSPRLATAFANRQTLPQDRVYAPGTNPEFRSAIDHATITKESLADLQGEGVTAGADGLVFANNHSYLETGLGQVGPDVVLTLEVTPTGEGPQGILTDGRNAIFLSDQDGKLAYINEHLHIQFDKTLEAGRRYKVTFVTKELKTDVYVDDVKIARLPQAAHPNLAHTTFVLPLNYIAGFKGTLHRLDLTHDPYVSPLVVSPSEIADLTTNSQDTEHGGQIDKAFDGNSSTIWHSHWTNKQPHYTVDIALKQPTALQSLTYLPRQSGTNGHIRRYEVYAKVEGQLTKIAEGQWANDAAEKVANFTPLTTNHIQLKILEGTGGFASAAELTLNKVLTQPGETASPDATDEQPDNGVSPEAPKPANPIIKQLSNQQTASATGNKIVLEDDVKDYLKTAEEGTIYVEYRVPQNAPAFYSIFNATSGNNQNQYTVLYAKNGQIGAEIRPSVTIDLNAGTERVKNGEWHAVAMTYGKNPENGQNIVKLYVNGVLSQSKDIEPDVFKAITNLTHAQLGAAQRVNGPVWGVAGMDIRNFTLYNKALTAEEVVERSEAFIRVPYDLPANPGEVATAKAAVFESGRNGQKNRDGVHSFRIPALLKTLDGTLIAATDQRHTTSGDWGDIATSIKRSTDNGATWGDTIKIVDLKNNPNPANPNFNPMTIDPGLVQEPTTKRIFALYDMFPEMQGAFGLSNRRPASYTTVGEQSYLNLYKAGETAAYTIRENGVVYTPAGEATDYRVNVNDNSQHYANLGDIYQGNTLIGNVYYQTNSSSPFKVAPSMHIWMSYSDDDGVTWSRPKDLTASLKKNKEYMNFMGIGPGTGVVLHTGEHKGRLVIPAYATNFIGNSAINNSQSSMVFYSDDHGETWHSGESVNDNRRLADGTVLNLRDMDNRIEQMTEATLLQLNNGHLKMFMRNLKGKVHMATSLDGGATWQNDLETLIDVPDVYVQLSAVRVERDGKEYVVLANANGPGRTNGHVRLAEVTENGQLNWINHRLIQDGSFAYNSLQYLGNDEFGLLYEHSEGGQNDYTQYYRKFNWTFLTSPEPKLPDNNVTSVVFEDDTTALISFDYSVLPTNRPELLLSNGNRATFIDQRSGNTLAYRIQPTDKGKLILEVVNGDISNINGHRVNVVTTLDDTNRNQLSKIDNKLLAITAGRAEAWQPGAEPDKLLDGNKATVAELKWDMSSNYVNGAYPEAWRLPQTVTITVKNGQPLDLHGLLISKRINNNGTLTKYQVEAFRGDETVYSSGELLVPYEQAEVSHGFGEAGVKADRVVLTLLEAKQTAGGPATPTMLTLRELALFGSQISAESDTTDTDSNTGGDQDGNTETNTGEHTGADQEGSTSSDHGDSDSGNQSGDAGQDSGATDDSAGTTPAPGDDQNNGGSQGDNADNDSGDNTDTNQGDNTTTPDTMQPPRQITDVNPQTDSGIIAEVQSADAKVAGLRVVFHKETNNPETPAILKGTDYDLFDIELVDTDGNIVKPTAPVDVYLPIDDGKDVAQVVYLPNSDQSHALPFTTITRDGKRYAKFTAEHFSEYGIVYEPQSTPDPDHVPTPGTPGQGGDTSNPGNSGINQGNTPDTGNTPNKPMDKAKLATDLLKSIDASNLTDEQKGDLAVKVAFAETEAELEAIKAEVAKLVKSTSRSATAPAASALASATVGKKGLPATGDVHTALAAVGATALLSALGLAGRRRRAR